MTVQKRHNTNTTRRTGNTFHLQANDVTSRQILDKILPETQKRQKRFFILYYIADMFFYAPSQNWKKKLLALSCLFVCPHETTFLPMDVFS